jgi:hypothetical protein
MTTICCMNARLVIVLTSLLAVGCAWSADTTSSPPQGELFFAALANAPFPHQSRSNGFIRDGKTYNSTNHYSDDRVAFFIPKDFRPGTNVDVVVHFHGWRAKVEEVPGKFHLIEQFVASRKNAILILPQGPRDAPDSFGGKLEDAGGFERFMDEAMAKLRARPGLSNASVGRIALSGHSGGYQVIASILDAGGLTPQIDEVFLFDAMYGRTDSFLKFLENRPDTRLIAIYTKDGGTLKETQKFIGLLREKKILALVRQEEGVRPRDLRGARACVLFSDLGHSEVIYARSQFRDYLGTSRLSSLDPKSKDQPAKK